MRKRQDEVAPRAVLQLEDDGDSNPAARLPEFRGRQHRLEHLLPTDRVDLLADDLGDFLVHAPPERQKRE